MSLWSTLSDPTIIASIIGVFSGAGGGVLAPYFARRLRKDATETPTSYGWTALVSSLRDEIASLHDDLEAKELRVASLGRRIDECERDRRDLRRQLENLRGK